MSDLQSKKAAWAALLHLGKLNPSWNCYSISYQYAGDEDAARAAILMHGIDWDETDAPQEINNGVFSGTFSDNDGTVSCMEGTLHLKNGKTQRWAMVADSSALADLARVFMDVQQFAKFIAILGSP